MVERSGDYAAPIGEMTPPASGDMSPAYGDPGMPNDTDAAALSDGGFVEEPETIDDGPLDPDQLRSQLQQELESTFQIDKANIQRSFSQKEEQLLSDVFTAQEQAFTVNQQLAEAMNWFKGYMERTGADPRDASELMLKVMGAERNASRQTQAQRAEVSGWLGRQNGGFLEEVNRRSVDSENGQQLFDPVDPELQESFSRFLDVGRRFMASGQRNPKLGGEYQSSWADYQRLLSAKERAGYRGSSAQAPTAAPIPGAPATPAENRAKGVARGAQNRLTGGSAAVTNESIMNEGRQRYPGSDRDALTKRQAFFVQQRRQHNIQG